MLSHVSGVAQDTVRTRLPSVPVKGTTDIGEVSALAEDTSSASSPRRSVAPALPPSTPPQSDAATVHAALRRLQSCGNEVRMALLDGLRALHDRSLFYDLGYAGYAQYCDRELGLPRSTAYEFLRVAVSLDGLPALRRLFREGELSWEQVRAISRVATSSTESLWIEMAWTHPIRDLLAEVREAARTGRDAPRRSRYGLPNLVVDLGVKVTLEEKARVQAAFSLVAEALEAAAPGANRVTDEPDTATQQGGRATAATPRTDGRSPIVRWADAVLSGLLPLTSQVCSAAHGRKADRPHRAQTIVYHTCPACRRSSVETEDGRVSVSPDRIEALAPFADHVSVDAAEGAIGVVHDRGNVVAAPSEPDRPGGAAARVAVEQRYRTTASNRLDRPTNAALRRQVLHRDGLVCANPACGRRHDLHAQSCSARAAAARCCRTRSPCAPRVTRSSTPACSR